MPVTAILELQFRPDAVADAVKLFERVLVDTRAFDGCLGVTLVQDQADPGHVIAIEQWESVEHDARYREWRAGDGAILDLPAMLAGVPRLSICETVAAL